VTQTGDWTDSIIAIAMLDEATRMRLRSMAQPVSAPAGTRIFSEGSPCAAYLILLSGQMRVRKIGENGREIVLYRVEPGETCIVTTACLMAGTPYNAEGIAETDIQARALPMAAFRALLAASATFRDFVFARMEPASPTCCCCSKRLRSAGSTSAWPPACWNSAAGATKSRSRITTWRWSWAPRVRSSAASSRNSSAWAGSGWPAATSWLSSPMPWMG
jgi:hypothetical protein